MTDQTGGGGPRRAGEVKVSSGSHTIACRDATGVECDFTARLDVSPQGASGNDIDQLLAQLATHAAISHVGYALGNEQLRELRQRFATAA